MENGTLNASDEWQCMPIAHCRLQSEPCAQLVHEFTNDKTTKWLASLHPHYYYLSTHQQIMLIGSLYSSNRMMKKRSNEKSINSSRTQSDECYLKGISLLLGPFITHSRAKQLVKAANAAGALFVKRADSLKQLEKMLGRDALQYCVISSEDKLQTRTIQKLKRVLCQQQPMPHIVSERWLSACVRAKALLGIEQYEVKPEHVVSMSHNAAIPSGTHHDDGGGDGDHAPKAKKRKLDKTEADKEALSRAVRREYPLQHHNHHLTDKFEEYCTFKDAQATTAMLQQRIAATRQNIIDHSILAFICNDGRILSRKCIASLRASPAKISCKADAMGLDFVGDKSAQRIESICKTGTFPELETLRKSDRANALVQYCKILGVGPSKAIEWYDKNSLLTLDQIRTAVQVW